MRFRFATVNQTAHPASCYHQIDSFNRPFDRQYAWSTLVSPQLLEAASSWFGQYYTLSYAAILYFVKSAFINSAFINFAYSARGLEREERIATEARATVTISDNCREYHGEHHEARQQYIWQQKHPLDNLTSVHRTIFWRLSYMPQQYITSRLLAHSAQLHWILERHRSNRARMMRWERAGFIDHYQHGYKTEARTKATVCISAIRPWGHNHFYFLWAFVTDSLPGIHIRLSAA